MILVRAPLRITFAGDATDIKEFYKNYPGQVLSATIDKFIYIAIKDTALLNTFIMKYHETECVTHPSKLKHDRFRASLLDLGIVDKGVEIASFADIPAKTGLGSSSTFSVALLKGLNAYLGKTLSKEDVARAACRLEIDLLSEPIGKQDQYAAAYGGFNVIRFNPDESVGVEPALISFEKKTKLEDHVLLFYTGMTRAASSVLSEQCSLIKDKFDTYKKMADSVDGCREALIEGDIKRLAGIISQEWEWKKTLASNVSNDIIDQLYDDALCSGAWGGKVMGAGDGGCLFLITSPENKDNIRHRLNQTANQFNLNEFQEIPVKFMQSGSDILFNTMNN
jgi:D-glycero-alpha-D-manno-heptose-7-phosphate kinase